MRRPLAMLFLVTLVPACASIGGGDPTIDPSGGLGATSAPQTTEGGVAVTGGEGSVHPPSPGAPFPARTLEETPLSLEDVVQHRLEAPEYPAGVTVDEPLMVELRSPDLRERHHLFLADLESGSRAATAPEPGSVILVPQGASLEIGADASYATLRAEEVGRVEACPAPCSVVGPALVGAEAWLPGIGTAPGWLLVRPAPSE